MNRNSQSFSRESLRPAARQQLRFSAPMLVAAATAAVWWVSAGSLTPPAGPIASTMKDLATVEPRTPVSAATTPGDADSLFRILQPGSYYLTGNIAGVNGKSGVEIANNGVTLDLMGFELLGVVGSLDGVRVSVVGARDIAVVNGSVRNWTGDGVDLANATANRLTDLRVVGSNSNGISAGTNAVVTGCAAYDNGSAGILAGSSSTITNCSAHANMGDGIAAFGSSRISGCSANNNGGDGIETDVGSTITNCSAGDNMGDGFKAISGSTITNSSARANIGDGIETDFGSTITNCSTAYNSGDGIRVNNDCTVRGNTCAGNGNGAADSAGIHVFGFDNRIEGNNCTDNDRGIDVDSPGNFITRNTCTGNTTNWDVVAGNVCLVVSAAIGGPIVGNSGGVAPGSTDPNANFTY